MVRGDITVEEISAGEGSYMQSAVLAKARGEHSRLFVD